MKLCNRGYCTCFWDKFLGYVLVPCCKLHDFNYAKQKVKRAEADKRFFKCLKKHSFFLLAGSMWLAVRLFGWYFWNKAKREKMKTKSNAILFYDEMMDWFIEASSNNYEDLGKMDGNIFHVTPFVCDFEVVNKDGEIILRGVRGQGLGYDMITRTLKIIEKGN